MVTIRSRSTGVMPTEAIQLTAKFYDFAGNLTDLDSFPTISIIQPDGLVLLGPSSAGVYRQKSTGVYSYLLDVQYNYPLGVSIDRWVGQLNGFTMQAEFNFVVAVGDQVKLPTDGYLVLGQDLGFNYSQNAIANIDSLIKGLRNRLKSSGLAKTLDEFSNPIYQTCDVFSVDQLVTFLATALSAFNMIPTFTEFTFEDSEIIRTFYAVIIQHAVLSALSAQAIIERGREMNITDNGISLVMPSIAEMLNSQYTAELGNWTDMVKLIKQNMKPICQGIASYSSLGSPRLRILRTLRQRQIF